MQSEAPEHKSIVVHIQKWKQGWYGQASEVLLCRAKDRVGQRCNAIFGFGHAAFGVFVRSRRFDLCNQVRISIHLDCISGALHSFSGIITLADHLAGFAVSISTADNKFTAASTYALENRHHAHSCSVLDFATRAFFIYLKVAPAFVVRRLCGLVCGTDLSLCIAPCLPFCFYSVA